MPEQSSPAPPSLPQDLRTVFVAGPPKCGTTWMCHTLNAHPQAVVRGESNIAPELLWPMLGPAGTYIGKYGHAFGEQDLRDTMRFAVDRLLSSYLEQDRAEGRERPALRVVGDKSPGHTRHVALLDWLYPDARFVICVRDVRDAAVSAYMHFVRRSPSGRNFFGVGDAMERVAEIYARNHWAEMLRFARANEQRLGPERYLEIEYAAHKTEPHATVERICAFLGLDCDPAVIDAVVDTNSFERRSGGRRAGEEASDAVRKGIVGDWRNHFTPEFGAHLQQVAEERLALGERLVQNTLDLTWTGGHALLEPSHA